MGRRKGKNKKNQLPAIASLYKITVFHRDTKGKRTWDYVWVNSDEKLNAAQAKLEENNIYFTVEKIR